MRQEIARQGSNKRGPAVEPLVLVRAFARRVGRGRGGEPETGVARGADARRPDLRRPRGGVGGAHRRVVILRLRVIAATEGAHPIARRDASEGGVVVGQRVGAAGQRILADPRRGDLGAGGGCRCEDKHSKSCTRESSVESAEAREKKRRGGQRCEGEPIWRARGRETMSGQGRGRRSTRPSATALPSRGLWLGEGGDATCASGKAGEVWAVQRKKLCSGGWLAYLCRTSTSRRRACRGRPRQLWSARRTQQGRHKQVSADSSRFRGSCCCRRRGPRRRTSGRR